MIFLLFWQYFNLKISYKNIAPEEFSKDIDDFEEILNEYMNLSRNLSLKIKDGLKDLKYE